MSVAQVKKRFSEFESYLGRDKEALRRLKLLKDDVNVLRTSLAAAEEKAERAEVIKQSARERADAADIQSNELKNENERLRMLVTTLEAKISLMESKQHAKEENAEDLSETTEDPNGHVECKKMLKALRRVLPQCPALTSARSVRHCPSFIRQEFAKGWSHQSIWALGASVAIIAAHEGGVTIIDPVGVDFKRKEDPVLSGMVTNFIRWFGRNFKQNYESKRVYFGNEGPAELIDPHEAGRI